MAKRKPTFTLVDMERKLRYEIDSSSYADKNVKRFYSDLAPVPNSVYERTKKEFEEHEKQAFHKAYETVSEKVLPEFGVPKTIRHGQDTVTFRRRSDVGFYTFAVDIHYGFGLDLPLLFSKNEALRALTVPELQPDTTGSLDPMFLKLPKELRDKIYIFALPRGKWKIGDVDSSDKLNFAGGIGDLSGFYFPRRSLAMLGVNRQMRQEALPFAYRRTVFHFDDMDDLIKLLIAVGDIGRDNIESLELSWQSRTDTEFQWTEAPVRNEHSLTLPTLHVTKCVQLLKQCKRLRFLRLYFESDLILGMSPTACKADPGICELRSVRGIETIEICDFGCKPLEQCGFVKWLKEAMESSEKNEKNEMEVGKAQLAYDHRVTCDTNVKG